MSSAHHTQDSQPVALITGAARRIGRAIAEELHAAGYRVVIHYHRSNDDAQSLVRKLNEQRKNSAIKLQADLLDSNAIKKLARSAQQQWGRIDLLVNNASTFYPTPLNALNEPQWLDLMGSNLKAPMLLSAEIAPELARQQGQVVNIVDIHANSALRDHHIYCAAKAGLASLTRNLALSLGPEVRVNAIAPGAILWPGNDDDISETAKQSIIAGTALQRIGHPGDIAKAVVFLAGSDAAYMTGQCIAVDGGRHLYQP